MRALARVGVLVEMRAVELGEAVSVAREMRGSPIENDAEASLVTAIHKFHEFGGSAVAAGGGKVAEGLVAPRAVEGMLHNGEQFDVGVAEILDIGDELVAELAIVEPAIMLFRDAAPGAEMDFVDGDRRFEPVFLRALSDPIRVGPFMVIEARDDGAGIGAQFRAESVGIGFEGENVAARANDFIFVDGTFGEFGDEDFPETGGAAGTHGMDATVPAIEVTHNADALCAGGPNGEVNSADAFEGDHVGAEFFVSVVMAALAHEVEIELAEHHGKGIGVEHFE